jgi:hypothetical protein
MGGSLFQEGVGEGEKAARENCFWSIGFLPFDFLSFA